MRERAETLECETVQIFTSNPRGWRSAALKREDVAQFRRDVKESGISPVFAHVPYLPNLAAAKGSFLKQSLEAVAEELRRCDELGIPFLVTHVGKALGSSEGQALEQVAESVNWVLDSARNRVMLLLENTAGMGSEVGYRFGQIAETISMVEDRDRVGVMLDTAHAFAAGYDWRTKAGADLALREFDATVGMGRLYGLHLNDSKSDCGSRIDRHWHIGKGRIGREGMRLIVNHPLLRHLPAVMETPRTSDREDRMNMRTARGLAS